MDAKDLGWSKRLKGMRDLKEDMYDSDIWDAWVGRSKNMKTKKRQRTKTQSYKI